MPTIRAFIFILAFTIVDCKRVTDVADGQQLIAELTKGGLRISELEHELEKVRDRQFAIIQELVALTPPPIDVDGKADDATKGTIDVGDVGGNALNGEAERVSKEVGVHEASAAIDAKGLLQEQEHEQLDADKNFVEKQSDLEGANHNSNSTVSGWGFSNSTVPGKEICCMCTDGHNVRDGEDYGYSWGRSKHGAMMRCQRDCLRACSVKGYGLQPFTRGGNHYGCYDEPLLAQMAPMMNSWGLARIHTDDRPGDYC